MTVADADKTNVFWCAVVWIFPSLLLFLCYSYLDVPLRRRGEGEGGEREGAEGKERRRGEEGRGKERGKGQERREGGGRVRRRWESKREGGGKVKGRREW